MHGSEHQCDLAKKRDESSFYRTITLIESTIITVIERCTLSLFDYNNGKDLAMGQFGGRKSGRPDQGHLLLQNKGNIHPLKLQRKK